MSTETGQLRGAWAVMEFQVARLDQEAAVATREARARAVVNVELNIGDPAPLQNGAFVVVAEATLSNEGDSDIVIRLGSPDRGPFQFAHLGSDGWTHYDQSYALTIIESDKVGASGMTHMQPGATAHFVGSITTELPGLHMVTFSCSVGTGEKELEQATAALSRELGGAREPVGGPVLTRSLFFFVEKEQTAP